MFLGQKFCNTYVTLYTHTHTHTHIYIIVWCKHCVYNLSFGRADFHQVLFLAQLPKRGSDDFVFIVGIINENQRRVQHTNVITSRTPMSICKALIRVVPCDGHDFKQILLWLLQNLL